MSRTLLLLGALLLLWVPRPVGAQLLFNLNPAGLSGGPGDTLVFNATLKNTGNNTIFLNGDSASLPAQGLQLDDSPFFNNFPFFLAGGDSATANILNVTIAPSVPSGDFTGTFQIFGGSDGSAQDILGGQNFLVKVSSVPEPGPLALVVSCGISAVLFIVHRFRRR